MFQEQQFLEAQRISPLLLRLWRGYFFLLYGRLPLVTRGLLYSPLIYLSRVGRSITAQVGLVLAAQGQLLLLL